MNTVDFSQYKFRPSGLKYLMTNSRSKSDPLSETTKSYLNEVYIEAVFNRKKLITSPAMTKGTTVESDSLDLVQKVLNRTYFKNQRKNGDAFTHQNDYIQGTPDVVDKKTNLVIDIKSSWDIWTYAKVTADNAKKDYYWQVLGYAWLTGMRNMWLVYALVDTPEFVIKDELYRMSFKFSPDTDMEQFRPNFIYQDVPDELKIKKYEFEYNDDHVIELIERIKLCRDYLSNLSLGGVTV